MFEFIYVILTANVFYIYFATIVHKTAEMFDYVFCITIRFVRKMPCAKEGRGQTTNTQPASDPQPLDICVQEK